MILKLAFPGKHQAHSALDRASSHNREMTEIKVWEHKATFLNLLAGPIKSAKRTYLLRAPLKTLLCAHALITVERLPGIGLFFKDANHRLRFGWCFLLSKA